FGQPLQVLNLAYLGELPGPARQPLDDVVLELPELREVHFRLAELHAPCLRVARLVDDVRDMEQRLRRDAAPIHAHAARIRFWIHERDAEAEIGAEKRGRIP